MARRPRKTNEFYAALPVDQNAIIEQVELQDVELEAKLAEEAAEAYEDAEEAEIEEVEVKDAGTEEEKPKTGGIVPKVFKERYAATGNNCGDEVAEMMAEIVNVPVKGRKNPGVDLERLAEVGRQNNIDVAARWGHLNPGQQRMNLGNVLRGKVNRAEEDVFIGPYKFNKEEGSWTKSKAA